MNNLHVDALSAACDGIVGEVDIGSTDSAGDLRIYSGSVGGTLLAELAFANPAFGDASAGIAIAASISEDGSAAATGNPAAFQVRDRDNQAVWQGVAGGPNSGAELEFDSSTITAGDVVAVSAMSFQVTEGVPIEDVSRISGTAPLGVHFDATAIDVPATTQPFFNAAYSWDFGDPGSGTWGFGNQESRNTAFGPIAAHVYENPGSYAVTVSIRASDGQIVRGFSRITVTDPDSDYPGTQTVVISQAGDFSGAPSGADPITTSDWADVRAELVSSAASPKRVLLRRGETWTVDATHTFAATNVGGTLGAFGTGAKPIANISGGGAIFVYRGSDWRIMDIDARDATVNDGDFLTSGGTDMMEDLLLLRVETLDFNRILLCSMGQNLVGYTSGRAHGPVFFADCEFHNTTPDVNNQVKMLMSLEQSAFLGCSYQHQPPNPPTDPNTASGMRFVWARKLVFSNTKMYDRADGHKAILRFHGVEINPSNPNYSDLYTEELVISGNDIDMGSGIPWRIDPVNPNDYEQHFRKILVERNWIRRTDATLGGQDILMRGGNEVSDDVAHFRRNVFYRANAATVILIDENAGTGTSPAPRAVKIYNNTFHTDDTVATWFPLSVASAISDGIDIHSNIGFGQNASAVDLASGGGAWTEDSNVTGTDSPANWFVTNPPTQPTHFKLVSGANAVDAGRTGEERHYHYDGVLLPTSQAQDCGAWERL